MTDPGAELQGITALLDQAHAGRPGALDEVVAIVYPRLLGLARDRLRGFGNGRGSPTLEPAALVNETYLKLIRQRSRYDSRGHFFAIASQLMLRVLIDHERARGRGKRGGGLARVSLSEADAEQGPVADVSVEAFAEALGRLEALSRRSADIVKARLLWGLTVAEIADALGVSGRTVEREWSFAQRWLEMQLAKGDTP